MKGLVCFMRELYLGRPKLCKPRTVRPTNPRIRRVLKNRQVNLGSFTPHTVSSMHYLHAVIVRNSKPLRFCFGEQESEPHPQMSDRPAHSSHKFSSELLLHIIFH